MPITPFHLGPAAAVKGVIPRHFSFLVFAFSQFLIDLEPLYYMVRDESPLHRFFHTYPGATVIAVTSYFVGRPIAGICVAAYRHSLELSYAGVKSAAGLISRTQALTGAAIGAYSHIALDSIMHSDMRPFAPFTDANSLLHVISIRDLHLYCFYAAVFGVVVMGIRRWSSDKE